MVKLRHLPAALLLVLLIGTLLTGCVQECEVSLDAEPEEAGEVTGDGVYEKGEKVEVLAEPGEGYVFKKWMKDGEKVNSNERYRFEIEEDKDLQAEFAKKEYEVEVESSDEEKGKVTGAGSYEHGETVTVRAEPGERYEFEGWYDGEGKMISEDELFEFTADKSINLKAEFQPGFTVTDKTEETDWSLEEVNESAHKAFSVYTSAVPGHSILASRAEDKLRQGDLTIKYPLGSEDIDIGLEEIVTYEERVEVRAEISYPHIDSGAFEKMKKEIHEEILSKAGAGAVCVDEIFSTIIREAQLTEKTTGKTLEIEEVEEVENRLQVVRIDSPEDLLSSFDKLYRRAVAEPVEEVIVNLAINEPAQVVFDGKDLEMEFPSPSWSNLDPYYLLEETNIVLPDKTELALADIWEQLLEHTSLTPNMGYAPEAYFSEIETRETSKEGKKSIYFTRPYALATMDSVIGYVDTDTGEINLFGSALAPGGRVSDFYWSPDGDYLGYHYSESGSDYTYLKIYNVHEDRVMSVTDFQKFQDRYGQDRYGQEFVGEFKNLEWTNDHVLGFELIPHKEDESFSYEINAREKELASKEEEF